MGPTESFPSLDIQQPNRRMQILTPNKLIKAPIKQSLFIHYFLGHIYLHENVQMPLLPYPSSSSFSVFFHGEPVRVVGQSGPIDIPNRMMLNAFQI